MKGKKGFVVSWFYPPINSSESFVTFKLLSNSKLRYDVWTRDNRSEGVWDRRVEEEVLTSDNINVIVGDGSNKKRWMDEAVKYFSEHVNEYDFIMTRSMPPEVHEIGRRIKKAFPHIKWIASYGDPLIGTPYLESGGKTNPYYLKEYIEKENPSKLRLVRLAVSPMRNAQKFVWRKEQEAAGLKTTYGHINDFTIKEADILISNNELQLNHIFSGKYHKYINKGRTLFHSFDERFFEKEKKKKSGKKIRFVYTGHLDVFRNAQSLLKAIKMIIEKDDKLEEKVEFDFYGHISDKDKVFILDNNLQNIVKIHGDISYYDSLNVMREADWLMVFDANFMKYMDENIYFPAKLADYIGSGSNIMAITQIEGITSDIVRKVGGGVVCSYSADEIAMYLSMIIYRKYAPCNVNEEEKEKFDARTIGKKFDKMLSEVIA